MTLHPYDDAVEWIKQQNDVVDAEEWLKEQRDSLVAD